MRVYVKNGKRLIGVFLPSGWVFNGFTALWLPKALATQDIQISREQLQELFRVINRYRRAHKDWVLAECHTHDGEKIFVKL